MKPAGGSAKYRQIARVLRSRIVRGVYEDRLPGERRLGVEFGVNHKTVESALVQLEAQGFVRRTLRQGTFACLPGPDTKHAERAFLCLVVPTICGTVWAMPVLEAFEVAAESYGLQTVMKNFSGALTSLRSVRSLLTEASGRGCVGTCLLSVELNTRGALALVGAASPVVVADWDLEEPVIPCVVFDNFGAGRLAAEHLLDLGHRRIAWGGMAANRSDSSCANRRRGVVAGLGEADLTLSHEICCVSGEHLGEELVALMQAPEPPTAMVCDGPTMGSVTVELALQAGLKVPGDLSVVMFGGAGDALNYTMATVVVMDYKGMGQRCLKILLDEDEFQHPHKEVLPARLVEGRTTSPPSQ